MADVPFEKIVDEYGSRVFNIAFRIIGRREDAEDAVQEIFLQAYRGYGRFRGESSPYTWLYRIAVRTSLRAKGKILPSEAESVIGAADKFDGTLPEEVADWKNNPEERYLYDELIRQIREGCLHFMSFKLTPEQRCIYILRTVLDFSYKEIAEILDIPLSAVKARLNRVKKNLLSFFSGDCQWLCGNESEGASASGGKTSSRGCSCEKRIGLALALNPQLLRGVKTAAIADDTSPSAAGVPAEEYPDVDALYRTLRQAEFDPRKIRDALKKI